MSDLSGPINLRDLAEHTDRAQFQANAEKRRRERMQHIDLMNADLRTLVHEYGLNTVKAFLDLGVTKPRHIRHLVETVLDEFSPTRGSRSNQGTSLAKGLGEP